jgi:hypothetical protein
MARSPITEKAHLEVLGRLVAETGGKEPKGKAMAILATMVGALTLSRAVNDPDLAQAFLDAAAQQVRAAAEALPLPAFPNPSIDDGENNVETVDQLGNRNSRRNR